MEEKEKKIADLADRWIDEKIIPDTPVKVWLEARNIQKPEDLYLTNVIPSTDTIKQADEFPILEDQITFLEKANESYISILDYFEEVFKIEREETKEIESGD